MATFEQNLAKILGEAIYGPDMRTAIAEAIEQADDVIAQTVATYKEQVDNAVGGAMRRMDTMQVIIDNHMWYLSISQIELSDDFLLTITEGEET